MMMWIGLQTPPDIIKGLFGVNSVAEINTEETHVPILANDFNERVRDLIQSIRKERRRAMRVTIFILHFRIHMHINLFMVQMILIVSQLTMVRQHDKLEMVFRHFLVEDDGRNGASSYMDFLCHVHKEIRGLL